MAYTAAAGSLSGALAVDEADLAELRALDHAADPNHPDHQDTPAPFAPLNGDATEAALAWLDLLAPDLRATRGRRRDLPTSALAYAERYHDDAPQIEQEWDALASALGLAWRQERYDLAARLALGLAGAAGRRPTLREGERVVRLGIAASRRAGDRRRAALLINRLGGLRFAWGRYAEGERLWSVGLRLAGAALEGLWRPLASFAYVADMRWGYGCRERLSATLDLLSERRTAALPAPGAPTDLARYDPSEAQAMALMIRGFYARFSGDRGQAGHDLATCLRASRQLMATTGAAPRLRVFLAAVQAELARARGEYARAQAAAETALTLASLYSDPYTSAALVADLGLYTAEQGRPRDTYAALLRMRALAARMSEAPHLARICAALEGRLGGALPQPPAVAAIAGGGGVEAPAQEWASEPLTARERETLELVARGLSNGEAAARLVVTPATVKKHLEHIYTKLGVNSRTAAIARARALRLLP